MKSGRPTSRASSRRPGGIYCYPLTVSDAHSRFVLDVQALPSGKQSGTIPVFQQLFERCGLPQAIRTDNGVPFATQALCGLSRLSVWWIKLGIGHQRIEPGQPYQNGRHERMHRTLKADTARPPASNMAAQQHCFDDWRTEFNTERPHEALSGDTPASHYCSSCRPMPDQTPDPEYPVHWEVRRVSRCGTFRIKKRQLFLSQALNEEHIAPLRRPRVASGVSTSTTYYSLASTNATLHSALLSQECYLCARSILLPICPTPTFYCLRRRNFFVRFWRLCRTVMISMRSSRS